MEKVYCRLTVYFEDPFWAGIYERQSGNGYEVCKITFGAEPADCELYGWLLQNWKRLRFGAPSGSVPPPAESRNPKRRQRMAAKLLHARGAGTRAQQAVAAAREQSRQERQVKNRQQRLREQQERYEKRKQRQKDKHRGR